MGATARHEGRSGRLWTNIVHFTRTLRAAGLPLGPGDTLAALEAVRAVGLGERTDFYWALHAVLVRRREQREIFDQAFHVFWRNPHLLEQMLAMLLPAQEAAGVATDQGAMHRRLREALRPVGAEARRQPEREEIELDATLTWSDREVLREIDFEQMSTAELALAKAAVARLSLALSTVPTRRFRSDPRGRRIDMRATLRRSLRAGSATIPLVRCERTRHPPALILLCDISGSMSSYSRLLLHFAHAVITHRTRVHCFVFGTRLTNVTRYLKQRDVDAALAEVATEVEDWSGGTRIGHCLETFNRDWLRRVCGQGAVVLLISDGLDRDAGEGLGRQVERLHLSCRRLIWLNPLLRYDAFEPKASGVRAILPHVDEFRPAHNLASFEGLIETLAAVASPHGNRARCNL